MKFSIKAIMIRAWEIKKQDKANLFGLCLKMAWEEAKQSSKPEFTGDMYIDGFGFRYWEKGSKRRIYINNCTGSNRSNQSGYIDLAADDRHGNPFISAVGCIKDAAIRFLKAYDLTKLQNC